MMILVLCFGMPGVVYMSVDNQVKRNFLPGCSVIGFRKTG